MNIDFKLKYLKYKKKYINLQKGGSDYTKIVTDIRQKQDSQLFNFYNLNSQSSMILQCKDKDKVYVCNPINITIDESIKADVPTKIYPNNNKINIGQYSPVISINYKDIYHNISFLTINYNKNKDSINNIILNNKTNYNLFKNIVGKFQFNIVKYQSKIIKYMLLDNKQQFKYVQYSPNPDDTINFTKFLRIYVLNLLRYIGKLIKISFENEESSNIIIYHYPGYSNGKGETYYLCKELPQGYTLHDLYREFYFFITIKNKIKYIYIGSDDWGNINVSNIPLNKIKIIQDIKIKDDETNVPPVLIYSNENLALPDWGGEW